MHTLRELKAIERLAFNLGFRKGLAQRAKTCRLPVLR